MLLVVNNASFSKSGSGINIDANNRKYWISLETLENYEITSPQQLINKCIELDDTKEIKSFGNYCFLRPSNIKKIILNVEEIEEIKETNLEKEKKEDEAFKNSIFSKGIKKAKNSNQTTKIDFDSIYNDVQFYKIVNDEKSMSNNERLIQKSIKLNKLKYNNGDVSTDDYNYSLIKSLTNENLDLFIEGKIPSLKIKKLEIPKINYKYRDDNNKILKILENENILSFSNKSDIEKFQKKKITFKEFIEKITKNANNKFARVNDWVKKAKIIEKEKGVNPLVLSWPFVKGKTAKGTFIHAPIAYRTIDITESLNEYEIKTSPQFQINTYPLLKHYADSYHKINDINIDNIDLKETLIEFYKHGMKITKPESDIVSNYKRTDYDEEKNYSNNFYTLSNEAIFQIKPNDEFIFYDLKNIIKKNIDFDLPKSTFNKKVINNESGLIKRKYITDVDNSKAVSIKNALNNSIVISGPPGTGKSETITNIIGGIIESGKTSLFLAEKSTAIEVIEKNLRKLGLDFFVINLNHNSTIELQSKFRKLSSIIDSPKYNELIDLKELDFAQEWIDKNGIKNEFIKLAKELDMKIEDLSQYEHLSKEIISTFTSECDINEVIEKINMNAQIYTQLDEFKNKLKLLEKTKAKLDKKIKLYEEIQDEEITNTLAKINSIEIVQKVYSTITDIKYLSDANDLKDVAQMILIKKPLLLNSFIKKHSKELKEISIITKSKSKDIQDINFKKINLEDERANNQKMIDEITNEMETFDKDIYEKFKDFKDFQKINLDLLDFAIKNYELVFVNMNLLWSEHKKIKNKHIEKIREITINNYAIRIKEFLNEEDNMSKYENIKKYINNNIERRGQSVLKAFLNGHSILKKVFPSLMMNPELVGKLLPPIKNMFDYCIFDEASQMRLHKGIPGLHRGKIAIVSGDEKQLGPTDLFSNIERDDDYNLNFEEDNSLLNDTILSYAKDKYMSVNLDVHYRSKSKELIEFSNETFYNGRIMTMDSMNPMFDGYPPIIVEEINGIWTDEYQNHEEAKKVIQLLKYYLKIKKSVGIITFNDPQMKLINENIAKDMEVSKLIRENKDSFFIKPIRSVQGDEMDIIIFSITYGKRRNSNSYTTTFGRFSKEKINVAITRSKFRMHILKSLPSTQVIGDDDSKIIFKRWLEYLENYQNKKNNFQDYENKFRSNLEKDYFEHLKNMLPSNIHPLANYNVGSKEIDVVLWNENSKTFIGAIELDGTRYHSEQIKVLKDYERQVFLENLGWHFYRISFHKFYANRDQCIRETLDYFNIPIELKISENI